MAGPFRTALQLDIICPIPLSIGMKFSEEMRELAGKYPRGFRYGIGSIFALALVAPWLASGTGIGHWPVVVGIVAARNLVFVGLALLAAGCLALAVSRRWRHWSLGFGVPLSVVAAVGLATVLLPGLGDHVGPDNSMRTLTVLSWNINGDLVDADTVDRVAEQTAADIVVMPAISPQVLSALQRDLSRRGFSAVTGDGSETVIFTKLDYVGAPSSAYGSVPSREAVALPRQAGQPVLVALHAPIPFLPENNSRWTDEMAWVGKWCTSGQTVVIIGDFNATNDNLASTSVSRCTDAAATQGMQHTGTWPTKLPRFLGLPIDHVFVGGAGLSVNSFDVVTSEDGGSARHRPIVATVRY